jgi:hypothetical protein
MLKDCQHKTLMKEVDDYGTVYYKCIFCDYILHSKSPNDCDSGCGCGCLILLFIIFLCI